MRRGFKLLCHVLAFEALMLCMYCARGADLTSNLNANVQAYHYGDYPSQQQHYGQADEYAPPATYKPDKYQEYSYNYREEAPKRFFSHEDMGPPSYSSRRHDSYEHYGEREEVVFVPGPRGPRGPPGPRGQQGPPGQDGQPGEAGVCASGDVYVARSSSTVDNPNTACGTPACVAATCNGGQVINGVCSSGLSTPFCVDASSSIPVDCSTQSPTSNVVGWACGAADAAGLSATVTCCGTRPAAGSTCSAAKPAQTGAGNQFNTSGAVENIQLEGCPNSVFLYGADWFRWTAPATSDVVISPDPSQGTVVAVFSTCIGPIQIQGACGSSVQFSASAGREYYIAIGSATPSPPISGDFTITISGGGTGGTTCQEATPAQTGDGNFFNIVTTPYWVDVDPCDDAITILNPVWFLWTAPESATFEVSTCAAFELDNTVDTVVAVLTGTCDAYSQVACAAWAQPDSSCADGTNINYGPAVAEFQAVSGQQYYIVIGTFYDYQTFSGPWSITKVAKRTSPGRSPTRAANAGHQKRRFKTRSGRFPRTLS